MPMTESPSGPARILVAEDNPPVREFIVRALTGAGHQVTAALDGMQALDLLGKEPFDLLITDIVMPHMDGIALVTQVERAYPKVRIILTSGYAQERVRAHNLNAIMYKLVPKPFSLEDICAAVTETLAQSSHPHRI